MATLAPRSVETDAAEDVNVRYTYFPSVDRPHSVVHGEEGTGMTKLYYAPGPTHSVAGLFDESNNVVNRYRYGPWGEAAHVTENWSNPLRYAGRRLDAETGLYYNRARYYDPDMGRFISQDPLGLEAGINPYTYAGNDPVNAFDPSGLLTCYRLNGIGYFDDFVACFATAEPLVVNARSSGGGAGGSAFFYDNVFSSRSYPRFTMPSMGDVMGGAIGGIHQAVDAVGEAMATDCGKEIGDALLSIGTDIAIIGTGGASLLLNGVSAGTSALRLGGAVARGSASLIGVGNAAVAGAGFAAGSRFGKFAVVGMGAPLNSSTVQAGTGVQLRGAVTGSRGLPEAIAEGTEVIPFVGSIVSTFDAGITCF